MNVQNFLLVALLAVFTAGCQTPPKMSQVDDDAPEKAINTHEMVQALKARQK